MGQPAQGEARVRRRRFAPVRGPSRRERRRRRDGAGRDVMPSFLMAQRTREARSARTASGGAPSGRRRRGDRDGAGPVVIPSDGTALQTREGPVSDLVGQTAVTAARTGVLHPETTASRPNRRPVAQTEARFGLRHHDADAGQTGALQAKPGAQQAKPTLKQAKPDAQQAKPELGLACCVMSDPKPCDQDPDAGQTSAPQAKPRLRQGLRSGGSRPQVEHYVNLWCPSLWSEGSRQAAEPSQQQPTGDALLARVSGGSRPQVEHYVNLWWSEGSRQAAEPSQQQPTGDAAGGHWSVTGQPHSLGWEPPDWRTWMQDHQSACGPASGREPPDSSMQEQYFSASVWLVSGQHHSTSVWSGASRQADAGNTVVIVRHQEPPATTWVGTSLRSGASRQLNAGAVFQCQPMAAPACGREPPDRQHSSNRQTESWGQEPPATTWVGTSLRSGASRQLDAGAVFQCQPIVGYVWSGASRQADAGNTVVIVRHQEPPATTWVGTSLWSGASRQLDAGAVFQCQPIVGYVWSGASRQADAGNTVVIVRHQEPPATTWVGTSLRSGASRQLNAGAVFQCQPMADRKLGSGASRQTATASQLVDRSLATESRGRVGSLLTAGCWEHPSTSLNTVASRDRSLPTDRHTEEACKDREYSRASLGSGASRQHSNHRDTVLGSFPIAGRNIIQESHRTETAFGRLPTAAGAGQESHYTVFRSLPTAKTCNSSLVDNIQSIKPHLSLSSDSDAERRFTRRNVEDKHEALPSIGVVGVVIGVIGVVAGKATRIFRERATRKRGSRVQVLEIIAECSSSGRSSRRCWAICRGRAGRCRCSSHSMGSSSKEGGDPPGHLLLTSPDVRSVPEDSGAVDTCKLNGSRSREG
ncbi:hypothetical protein C8F01DRAFT_1089013 [Mycena amicta]|nr:hypothetical protein C8F01DRAFT_1089013 [Mycena amicta]